VEEGDWVEFKRIVLVNADRTVAGEETLILETFLAARMTVLRCIFACLKGTLGR